MEVIQNANQDILSAYKDIFGKHVDGAEPKIQKYLVMSFVENGILLYNTLTKELIFTDQTEYIFTDYFYQHLFVMDGDVDETKMAVDIKRGLHNSRPRAFENINGYTIVTTTDCNANCFYCYEKGHNKIHMSDRVANDIADFILRTTKEGTIYLAWFGGEPLYNQKPIDIITGKLAEAGRDFVSSIITNGYFFDNETAAKAKEKWHMESAQITIDGLEDTYNKSKMFTKCEQGENNEQSPFIRVIENIKNLIRNEIFVQIRINVGWFNISEAFDLVKYLHNELDSRYYSIYPHELFDSFPHDVDTDEKRMEFYKKLGELDDLLIELGIHGSFLPLTNEVKAYHCMADNKRALTILTDGKIGLCEHFIDSNTIGSIYSDGFDGEKVKEFEEVDDFREECFNCPLFTECTRLKICEDNEKRCDTHRRRDYKISRIQKQMLQTFYQWRANNPNIDLEKGKNPNVCFDEKIEAEKLTYTWKN